MDLNIDCKVTSETGYEENIKGIIEIDDKKLEMLTKKCKEWKCSISDLVVFMIENLNEETADQLLSTMMF